MGRRRHHRHFNNRNHSNKFTLLNWLELPLVIGLVGLFIWSMFNAMPLMGFIILPCAFAGWLLYNPSKKYHPKELLHVIALGAVFFLILCGVLWYWLGMPLTWITPSQFIDKQPEVQEVEKPEPTPVKVPLTEPEKKALEQAVEQANLPKPPSTPTISSGTPDAEVIQYLGNPAEGYVLRTDKNWIEYQLRYYGKGYGNVVSSFNIDSCKGALYLNVRCGNEKLSSGYNAPVRKSYAEFKEATGIGCSVVKIYCK